MRSEKEEVKLWSVCDPRKVKLQWRCGCVDVDVDVDVDVVVVEERERERERVKVVSKSPSIHVVSSRATDDHAARRKGERGEGTRSRSSCVHRRDSLNDRWLRQERSEIFLFLSLSLTAVCMFGLVLFCSFGCVFHSLALLVRRQQQPPLGSFGWRERVFNHTRTLIASMQVRLEAGFPSLFLSLIHFVLSMLLFLPLTLLRLQLTRTQTKTRPDVEEPHGHSTTFSLVHSLTRDWRTCKARILFPLSSSFSSSLSTRESLSLSCVHLVSEARNVCNWHTHTYTQLATH